jgi:hypothetical protein
MKCRFTVPLDIWLLEYLINMALKLFGVQITSLLPHQYCVITVYIGIETPVRLCC